MVRRLYDGAFENFFRNFLFDPLCLLKFWIPHHRTLEWTTRISLLDRSFRNPSNELPLDLICYLRFFPVLYFHAPPGVKVVVPYVKR